MSIIGQVLGGSVGSAAEGIGNALDKLFTSDDERLSRQEVLERIRQKPHEWQADINKIEAQHRTLFVAGWRPAIGWTCALGLFWHFLGYDFALWVVTYTGSDIVPPKLVGTGNLLELTVGMLGMGGLRTLEKLKGVTR